MKPALSVSQIGCYSRCYIIVTYQRWWNGFDRPLNITFLKVSNFSLWWLQTSLPKVIWEEGHVMALSHIYAVKSPLLTMACPKFASKKTLPVDRSPNPTSCLIPGPVQPTMPNGIRIRSAVFPQCTGQTDRQTDRQTDQLTDRSQESLTTIGRCATRAMRPNNIACCLVTVLWWQIAKLFVYCYSCYIRKKVQHFF